ncbi:uncharacterized protein LOC127836236 isoform X2 [Dreissena polymorpha]|uniref:uncharacterized protein LOC127836236 isoform X2 n=1 Tax=Dreissena polymorpha TaxID=45954 RepID=UPI00226496F2|nr:uncharacterized protein LOC127836236 isoform X2 [Dreissena polymorpha]
MKRSVLVGRSYKEKESADPVIKKLTKTTFDEPTTGTFNFADTFNLRREKKESADPVNTKLTKTAYDEPTTGTFNFQDTFNLRPEKKWKLEIGSTVKPKLGATSNPEIGATSKLEIGATSTREIGATSQPEVGTEVFSGTYIDLDEINVPERAPHSVVRDSFDSGVTLRDSSDRLKRIRHNLDAAETTSISSSFIELQQVEATGQRSSFVSIQDYAVSLAGSSVDTTFQPKVNSATMASAYELRQTGHAAIGLESPEMTSTAALGRRSPVAVIPDRTLQLTPNSVASTSARRIGDITIDASNIGNPLARTMRAEMSRDAAAFMPEPGDLEYIGRAGIQNQQREPQPDDKKGGRWMPCKCVTFVLVCMMLIAGIMALTIILQKKKNLEPTPLGFVLPDPVAYDECPPSSIRLGKTLNFTCTIDTSHALRTKIKNVNLIELTDPKGVKVKGINFNPRYNGYILTIYVESGPSMTCSSQGNYTLYFKNNDTDELIHQDNVIISIKESIISTRTVQTMVNPVTYFNCTGERTKFDFTCALEGDCGNYQVDVFASVYGGEKSFNHKMTCSNTQNAINGTRTVCNTTFTEAEVTTHATLGCRFRDTASQYTTTGYLQLPTCERYENCSQLTSRWYVNCTKDSDHLGLIHNGNCSNDRIRRCFPSGRPLFRYEKVPFYDNKYDCGLKALTVPVCRLGWCKEYTRIVKDDSPGELLCSSTFDEKKADINMLTTAPLTTSPTSTSTPETTTTPPTTPSTSKSETTATLSTATSTSKPQTTAILPTATSTSKPETTATLSTATSTS